MTILNSVEAYNTLQKKVGVDINSEIDKDILSLFTENFKKTANGALLVENRAQLKDQLLGVREAAGQWAIDVKVQLPCLDKKHCVIRYHVISENLGTFDIMAVLRCQDNGLIEEINEVYYQVP